MEQVSREEWWDVIEVLNDKGELECREDEGDGTFSEIWTLNRRTYTLTVRGDPDEPWTYGQLEEVLID